jgi:hypothetical protein
MSDFNDFKTVTARKQHRCEFCGDLIKKREKYISQSGIFEGDFFHCALHQHCQNMINAYVAESGACEAYFDEVKDWLSDKCSGCYRINACVIRPEVCQLIIESFKEV